MGAVTGGSVLDQLAPAHAPPAPGWWPPAPGWWFVAMLGVLLAIALMAWFRSPSRRLRRAALRELLVLERRAAGDDASVARGVELLMRRYALQRFGAEATARLSGEAWIAFVANHGGKGLSGDVGRELLRAAYGGAAHPHRAAWLAGARGFLRSAK